MNGIRIKNDCNCLIESKLQNSIFHLRRWENSRYCPRYDYASLLQAELSFLQKSAFAPRHSRTLNSPQKYRWRSESERRTPPLGWESASSVPFYRRKATLWIKWYHRLDQRKQRGAVIDLAALSGEVYATPCVTSVSLIPLFLSSL